MINVDQDYVREVTCEYKGERYRVRDNGAIYRIAREDKPKRAKDEIWTFGDNIDKGYAKFCGESVHRIVAFAFIGQPPTQQHVVDHIDTNRQNNRPENLRWLTKLENILLNEYTRAKIEHLCGSVENFLANPSQLSGHETDDKNFAWMRAVTKEEAKNTLLNWEKLAKTPRKQQAAKNYIEEWIFNNNQEPKSQLCIPVPDTNIPATSFSVPSPSLWGNIDEKSDIEKGIASRHLNSFTSSDSYTEEQSVYDNSMRSGNHNKPDMKESINNYERSSENNVPEILGELARVSGKKSKVFSLGKKEFMSAMETALKANNLDYEKYYKADNWKVDFLITYRGKKYSFGAYTSEYKFSSNADLMSSDGVTGFGFSLNANSWLREKPYFDIFKSNDEYFVSIGDTDQTLQDYVRKAVEGKIIIHKTKLITAVDVKFVPIDCYACGATHYIYFVHYLVDSEGNTHQNDFGAYYEYEIPDLRFGEEIRFLVRTFISEHPELNIVMGEIKERYSGTMGHAYMSFGCPQCDSLLGSNYLHEIEIDVLYDNNPNMFHRMKLITPFEIPGLSWEVKE